MQTRSNCAVLNHRYSKCGCGLPSSRPWCFSLKIKRGAGWARINGKNYNRSVCIFTRYFVHQAPVEGKQATGDSCNEELRRWHGKNWQKNSRGGQPPCDQNQRQSCGAIWPLCGLRHHDGKHCQPTGLRRKVVHMPLKVIIDFQTLSLANSTRVFWMMRVHFRFDDFSSMADKIRKTFDVNLLGSATNEMPFLRHFSFLKESVRFQFSKLSFVWRGGHTEQRVNNWRASTTRQPCVNARGGHTGTR